MKLRSVFLSLLVAFTLSLFSLTVSAQKRKSYKAKTVHVKGYTKKNGTHVRGYYRSRKG
jgi:hypothetical protein